jgi:hypothetical protein
MIEQQIKPPAEVRYIQAHDIQSIRQELENLSTEVERNFLRIAEYLVLLDERQLYLASGYASLWAFLDSIPTFNYERRTAEMLMRVANRHVRVKRILHRLVQPFLVLRVHVRSL